MCVAMVKMCDAGHRLPWRAGSSPVSPGILVLGPEDSGHSVSPFVEGGGAGGCRDSALFWGELTSLLSLQPHPWEVRSSVMNGLLGRSKFIRVAATRSEDLSAFGSVEVEKESSA